MRNKLFVLNTLGLMYSTKVYLCYKGDCEFVYEQKD